MSAARDIVRGTLMTTVVGVLPGEQTKKQRRSMLGFPDEDDSLSGVQAFVDSVAAAADASFYWILGIFLAWTFITGKGPLAGLRNELIKWLVSIGGGLGLGIWLANQVRI